MQLQGILPSFGHIFDSVMSVNSEWAKYIPWVTTALLGGYVIYKTLHKKCCPSAEWVNKTVKKDCPKVVDKFDIEDLGDKNVYCRCWKSKEVGRL